jgi:hypothetical protein
LTKASINGARKMHLPFTLQETCFGICFTSDLRDPKRIATSTLLDILSSEELTISLSSPFCQLTVQLGMTQRTKALEKNKFVPEFSSATKTSWGVLDKLYNCSISSYVNWS